MRIHWRCPGVALHAASVSLGKSFYGKRCAACHQPHCDSVARKTARSRSQVQLAMLTEAKDCRVEVAHEACLTKCLEMHASTSDISLLRTTRIISVLCSLYDVK